MTPKIKTAAVLITKIATLSHEDIPNRMGVRKDEIKHVLGCVNFSTI